MCATELYAQKAPYDVFPPALFKPRFSRSPALAVGCSWAVRSGGACCLDGVGRCPEFVGGNVSYRRGLPRSERRMPRGSRQVACGGVRFPGCRARLRHRDLAPRPRSRLLDCLSRSGIRRLHRFKQRQYVLRAVRCPLSEKPMVSMLQSTAAANRDEPGVANLGEDHTAADLSLPTRTPAIDQSDCPRCRR